MERLNHCHDGSLKRICFSKNRELNQKDGSLIYPFETFEDRVLCDVVVEVLLNSYPDAKKNQVIVLEFGSVVRLRFAQDGNYDYSDIYEVKIDRDEGFSLRTIFYATEAKIPVLELGCRTLVCREL